MIVQYYFHGYRACSDVRRSKYKPRSITIAFSLNLNFFIDLRKPISCNILNCVFFSTAVTHQIHATSNVLAHYGFYHLNTA